MAVVVSLHDDDITKFVGRNPLSPNDMVERTGTIAFDNSYPNTGGTVGEIVTPAMFELDSIEVMVLFPHLGYLFEFHPASVTVRAYYGDTNAVADGALIQVPNATDLATLTAVPFTVYGAVDVTSITHELP